MLLCICLVFCQFRFGVAYKRVTYKKWLVCVQTFGFAFLGLKIHEISKLKKDLIGSTTGTTSGQTSTTNGQRMVRRVLRVDRRVLRVEKQVLRVEK